MFKHRHATRALAPLFCAALFAACACVAAAQDNMGQMNSAGRVDRRTLTTIQTATADCGTQQNAVVVRYLDLPWGEATFGYIETGVDERNKGYYSARTWPIAHMHLNMPATYDGHKLAPGDYAFIITPRNPQTNTGMTLSLASFKPDEPGGTFLKPGNVFVETPKDAQIISTKPIKFDKGGSVAPQLEMWVGKLNKKEIEIKFHYGDRTHTEKLTLK